MTATSDGLTFNSETNTLRLTLREIDVAARVLHPKMSKHAKNTDDFNRCAAVEVVCASCAKVVRAKRPRVARELRGGSVRF